MMKLAILFVLGVIAKQAYCDEPEAIVGGSTASVGQFPYQVALLNRGQFFCGGTLISTSHVMTAAHCLEGLSASTLTVVTGTNTPTVSGQRSSVKCTFIHPGYTGTVRDGFKHDIAMITLSKPITQTSLQAPIRLASKDLSGGGARCVISGWGSERVGGPTPYALKYVFANVVSLQKCASMHQYPINTNQICTLEGPGRGACHGDSGGPLVCNGELYGAVSWSEPCALNKPDVFSAIFKYLSWIKECQAKCS